MKRVVAALFLLTATEAAAVEIETPSGQTLTLYDVVLEPGGGMARFLFLAPGITMEEGAGVTYTEVQDDFPWLCEEVVLPSLAANEWDAGEAVISMADREVEFGSRDAEAVQFFEVFKIDGATCVWEGF
ncbi:DUF6497 family protein [Pelagovum pacificum]|uniref:Acetolactate synthase n=1 Tax=Pelagovum pacificum TaxID=2588711 RepID=A0A5C5GBE3_9RHOB|nr:DUF6497 family protein [Pelagovum pacificum]QQA41324.1 hypothetical protein I8N54_10825 [Pelagovum pacificum]TNY31870.1 hypothetical protein FHY64_00770 [Pelagovum pacificum]